MEAAPQRDAIVDPASSDLSLFKESPPDFQNLISFKLSDSNPVDLWLSFICGLELMQYCLAVLKMLHLFVCWSHLLSNFHSAHHQWHQVRVEGVWDQSECDGQIVPTTTDLESGPLYSTYVGPASILLSNCRMEFSLVVSYTMHCTVYVLFLQLWVWGEGWKIGTLVHEFEIVH